ncbi:hypothetical protein E2C01_097140 [Portunus trituberculatus]|uniref:Uncharacterized protein n=1 Tax=Portunus trituberculatus TaxID=210409 RepID=A0A5B7K3V3_PORTR|nr:hypothetical protein [Portunus trituberculatus]
MLTNSLALISRVPRRL